MTTSVETTFDLLAEAADVRHPNPERENRGLCPAHGDVNNPGLVFRIADSGKLVTHCFAQDCTPEDIADSIGVNLGAFFPDGGGQFAIKPKREFIEPSLLDLLKLLPINLSFDQQQDSVFRCLESAYRAGVIDNDTIDVEQPMRELPLNTVLTYVWLWVEDIFEERTNDWHDVSDTIISNLRRLNRSNRTHKLSSGSAIPRRT